ncbi:NADAR family protein [Candidatus Peregrinibacteria bacterium]|nr:NADAR family protein [Candidatus Peregrinibacteria bacterium]
MPLPDATNYTDALYFYAKNEPFGEFSNFAYFGFYLNGKFYPTVEHFYHAAKFLDTAYQQKILSAPTPKAAAELGKSRDHSIVHNWDQIRNHLMFLAVKRKFDHHQELKILLLSTENRLIIENSPYDHYWGIGKNGNGQNQLGKILMLIRAIYQLNK